MLAEEDEIVDDAYGVIEEDHRGVYDPMEDEFVANIQKVADQDQVMDKHVHVVNMQKNLCFVNDSYDSFWDKEIGKRGELVVDNDMQEDQLHDPIQEEAECLNSIQEEGRVTSSFDVVKEANHCFVFEEGTDDRNSVVAAGNQLDDEVKIIDAFLSSFDDNINDDMHVEDAKLHEEVNEHLEDKERGAYADWTNEDQFGDDRDRLLQQTKVQEDALAMEIKARTASLPFENDMLLREVKTELSICKDKEFVVIVEIIGGKEKHDNVLEEQDIFHDAQSEISKEVCLCEEFLDDVQAKVSEGIMIDKLLENEEYIAGLEVMNAGEGAEH